MKRLGTAALAALLWAASLNAQQPGSGALYIAGERFSLEQAIADATLEALGPDESAALQIVALGPEMRKLTLKGTRRGVREAVQQMQRAGGTFYVCERDLKQAGLAKKDLLSGVRIERAAAAKGSTPPALLRLRSLC